MNKLNVNPTRQELLKLKLKLKTAQRGHKLLKEKRDGLMKSFMAIIREAKDLRENIEGELGEGFKYFIFASAQMRPSEVRESIMWPGMKTSLQASTKNVMSVEIPQFEYHEEGDWLSYSISTTSSALDKSMEIFATTLQAMVKLAQIESSAKLLAAEIEKTRRRVNALEYVFIPDMQETIKYITDKLNEQERGAIVGLMRIKEIIAAEV
jgi:V/A-type H+/Na+-transporting ATPase subunit D